MFEVKKPKTYSLEKLEKMKRDELNTISVGLGLIPDDLTGEEDLINQIMAAQLVELREYEKRVVESREKTEKRKAEKVAKAEGLPSIDVAEDPDSDRIWVNIAGGSGPLDKGPVFLSINGDSVLVKRGHWVKLKKKFLPIIRDALTTQVELDMDNEDKSVLRNVPRLNIAVRSLEEGIPQQASSQLSQAF